MSEALLVTQLISTLAMVGVIWFVQIVHYPLFAKVGRAEFAEYEAAHQRRTTVVVAPLMLVELASAVLLLWNQPAGVSTVAVWLGFLLVLVIWSSTYLLQVPAHAKLSKGFDPQTHRWLVKSNWLRTISWSVRGFIACWMSIMAQQHSSH